MDQVFSKENKTLKKYWKIGKNTGKVREKSGNFVSPEKWEPCLVSGGSRNSLLDFNPSEGTGKRVFRTQI